MGLEHEIASFQIQRSKKIYRHNVIFTLYLCFSFCCGGYHFQFTHILSNLVFDKLNFRQTQCTKIQFIKMKFSSLNWNSIHQNEIQFIEIINLSKWNSVYRNEIQLSKWDSIYRNEILQNEIQFIPANEFHQNEKIENRYLFDKVDLWDFLEVAILRMVGKQKTWLPENDMKAFYGQNIEYGFIHV